MASALPATLPPRRAKALPVAELSAVRLVDFLDGWTADAKAKAPATWGDQRKHVDLLLAKVECNSILEAHREALNIVTELVGGCNLVPEAVN